MKITLICAPSLDGFLAHTDHDNVDWTSKEDKANFIATTKQMKAVIMGYNTWKMYSKPLEDRFAVVLTSKPEPDMEQVIFRTDPAQIMKELEDKGYSEAALIGGGGANSTFLSAGLIDEMLVTIIPRWFGGGIPMFAGTPQAQFELLDSKPLGPNEMLHHYRVVK
jgi:dihydrofolate reductase